MATGLPGARQALVGVAVVAGFAAYAVMSHRAASAPHPGLLEASVLVGPVMAFALLAAWRSSARRAWLCLWLAVAAGMFLARDRLLTGSAWVLLAQHVGIHVALCIAFGRTLAAGSVPMVSRLAERIHGDLSPRVRSYTRNVTRAWVVYFAGMAAASVLLFVFAPLDAWSVFINFLSLPLLLAMFAGEYIVRIVRIPPEERAGFLQSLGSWHQMSRDRQAPRH
ncbi:MAG: hypothetical protein EOO21_01975 [Comamonadaceae bacterium]|nr:MAG: hypothetical protein EOO21_01975 [Comamonadaceae bacterium]